MRFVESVGLVVSFLLMGIGILTMWNPNDHAVFMIGVLIVSLGGISSGLMLDLIKSERSVS